MTGPSPSPQALCGLGKCSRPFSSQAVPHCPLRPSVGRGIPQYLFHPRWPLTNTSSTSSVRPASPPWGAGTSLSPRCGQGTPHRPLPLHPDQRSLSAPSGPSPDFSPQASDSPSPYGAGPAPRALATSPRGRRPRAPGPALTAAGAVGPGRRGAGRRRPRRRRSCRGSAGRSPLRRRPWQLRGPPEAEAAARPRRPVAAAGEQR